MNVSIKKVTSQEDLKKCLALRIEVFVHGQKVPMDEEIDGKDETSEHYLLFIDHHPVGVARVRFVDDFAKIERVAILDDYQGKGLGKQLMEAILSELEKHATVTVAKLGAQTYAIPFYEKLGFIVCSEEYMDAGISHKDMKINFR